MGLIFTLWRNDAVSCVIQFYCTTFIELSKNIISSSYQQSETSEKCQLKMDYTGLEYTGAISWSNMSMNQTPRTRCSTGIRAASFSNTQLYYTYTSSPPSHNIWRIANMKTLRFFLRNTTILNFPFWFIWLIKTIVLFHSFRMFFI